MRWKLAALVIAVLGFASCGKSESATQLRSAVPCPGHEPELTEIPLENEEGTEQNDMQQDVETIDEYGRSAREYVNLRFNGPNVVVAFTDNLSEHRAALEPRLQHPDRISFIQTAHSRRELDVIRAAIQAVMQGDQFESVGLSFSLVDVGVRAGREDLADRYLERYGDALIVSVAGQPYVPEGCGDKPAPRPCETLRGDDPASANLEITIKVDEPVMSRYHNGSGEVVVRNNGAQPFTMDPGQPVLGAVVQPGTDRVIAGYSGAVGGTGFELDVPPGEERSVDLLFGTATCGRDDASALPPGVYAVRAVLAPEGRTHTPAYRSAETKVTLNDDPPPRVPEPPDLTWSPELRDS